MIVRFGAKVWVVFLPAVLSDMVVIMIMVIMLFRC